MERSLLNVADTALLLDVSADTVRRYADRGLLPVLRLPTGARRFEIDDVLELRGRMCAIPEKAEVPRG